MIIINVQQLFVFFWYWFIILLWYVDSPKIYITGECEENKSHFQRCKTTNIYLMFLFNRLRCWDIELYIFPQIIVTYYNRSHRNQLVSDVRLFATADSNTSSCCGGKIRLKYIRGQSNTKASTRLFKSFGWTMMHHYVFMYMHFVLWIFSWAQYTVNEKKLSTEWSDEWKNKLMNGT